MRGQPPSDVRDSLGFGLGAREKQVSRLRSTALSGNPAPVEMTKFWLKAMIRQTNSVRRRALGLGLLCAAVFALMGAGADPAARFHDLGHQMMCICGCGQVLLECNHVGCPDSDGMRNELMAAVTRGDSDSLVEQAFVQKYGPTVLAAPTTAGFDRAAYIVPFAALFFGAGLVVLVVRAWKNSPSAALPRGGTSPAPDEELEKFREQASRETEL